MKADYQKFANEGFLRTIDATLLHRFMSRHEIATSDLDPDVLLCDPVRGREAVRAFLLGPAARCPESLTADLHRIAKMDTSPALSILLEEAHRVGVTLTSDGEVSTTPRNVALRTFIEHPEVFAAAEEALDFIQPPTIAEFLSLEGGLRADLSLEVLNGLEASARLVFEADLRGGFCKVATHKDGDEVHLSLRHGAHLQTIEVVNDTRKRIVSFREIEKVVLAYSARDGRLKVWGGTKRHRTALADTFARLALCRPNLFKAAEARRLYTLGPAEQAGSAFNFRHQHDEQIASVQIYEVQANRTAKALRSQTERTIFSLLVRDQHGQALRRLHEGRPDISYGDGWRLNHLSLKIVFRSDGPRPRPLIVKIKPPEVVSFQRHRHQALVMELLRLNGMTRGRDVSEAALAAE